MIHTLPSWRGLVRPPRPGPLPITAAVIALLILGPASQLHRFPRSTAEGLERVVGVATLVQSFQSDRSRPVPLLWQERLGAQAATRLWTRLRGPWWQFWGREGAAHLVVPVRLFGPGDTVSLPAQAVRVDDLVIIAPDPLSLQTLQQQLSRRSRSPRGLEQRCVLLLRRSQAVAWTKLALAQISGDLAPLLQRFQQGCLAVKAEADGLSWQGEASARPDPVTAAPSVPAPVGLSRQALPPALLLEVQGARLDQLLEALLNNAVIRQPLMERYGLDQAALERLRRTPFLLRLRPQPKGPFLASLELQLAVGEERTIWTRWLAALRLALERQGLRERERTGGSGPAVPTAPLSASLWVRDDGTALGGWRWVVPARGGAPELLFVLGSSLPAAERFVPSRVPAGGGLHLRARPEALAGLGLLPAELPAVVRRSSQLEILSAPVGGAQGSPRGGAGSGGLGREPGSARGSRESGLSWVWGTLRLQDQSPSVEGPATGPGRVAPLPDGPSQPHALPKPEDAEPASGAGGA